MSEASSPKFLDESICAKEPIHIPGRIQPHGILLAFEKGRIVAASANAALFGTEILGRSLGETVGAELEGWIRRRSPGSTEAGSPVYLGNLEIKGRRFDAVLHLSVQGIWILELEEAPLDASAPLPTYDAISRLVERVDGDEGLERLWERAAEECRSLSGYDRVMIYQFDPEWNGTVIAEAKAEDMEPFLGLRYPASDIPAQARKLYERNWIRGIPNVDYAPVNIDAKLPAPLDLSYSALRSVSPVHLQYLKNMDVGASMSVSLLHEGRLWGLIAFHHRTARFLPYPLRQNLELAGKFLSLKIDAREKREKDQNRSGVSEKREAIESSLRAAVDFYAEMAKDPELYCGLVPGSTGGALLLPQRTIAIGAAPSAAQLDLLRKWLKEKLGRSPSFESECLSREIPWAGEIAGIASGMLAISIPEAEPAYLVWFKPEVAQTVSWAGKPEKFAPADQQTLGPRKSFALWTEVLRGRSLPFLAEERSEIDLFRRFVVELDLERQVRLANQSNADLDEFASAISHDLKEPLRGIRHFTGFVKEDAGSALTPVAKENLEMISSLAERAQGLITDLLSYSRVGKGELGIALVDLNEVVRETKNTLELRLQESNGRIHVPRPLPKILCDRVRVKEIFLNILENGLKYNESAEKIVTIEADESQVPPVIRIRDNGIGIPEKDREKVFGVFERLHPAGAFGGGTGIGLAIAKKAVERQGGRIWVEPNQKGSAFCFTLSPAR